MESTVCFVDIGGLYHIVPIVLVSHCVYGHSISVACMDEKPVLLRVKIFVNRTIKNSVRVTIRPLISPKKKLTIVLVVTRLVRNFNGFNGYR